MHLFSPLSMRDLEFRNRIVVSPMCQYSSEDGFADDWHLVHLGSRATGGAGLVIAEATAVEARGRISPSDLGIYHDEHVENLSRIARFVRSQGAVAGIQLAHAGRKASVRRPWEGGGPVGASEGGWRTVAPSAVPFDEGHPVPAALEELEIQEIILAFGAAALRAVDAGFQVAEIHGAHGYLLHEFLSPLSNRRTDRYGGDFENRTRLFKEVAEAIRREWPEEFPLFARISVTDWVEGGWDVESSIRLARELKPLGVDLIDCSSGGLVPNAPIPAGPGYQVPFAARIRREAGIPTGAVGIITSPVQADQIIRNGDADVAILGREMLRDPYWPYRAAKALGKEIVSPSQYARAWL
jgi:2,4-dienoyl-CoA reductase-like NADH-dependent reductase (Old Yellow Enzyme family)